jgi:hypothetical protein
MGDAGFKKPELWGISTVVRDRIAPAGAAPGLARSRATDYLRNGLF